ncbi:hypothetical protein B0H11DRAFT_1911368 [Mycena galericulata]|nr:hypothetical protein B0H11DRAFT_1911368 [Mycena galericulata]
MAAKYTSSFFAPAAPAPAPTIGTVPTTSVTTGSGPVNTAPADAPAVLPLGVHLLARPPTAVPPLPWNTPTPNSRLTTPMLSPTPSTRTLPRPPQARPPPTVRLPTTLLHPRQNVSAPTPQDAHPRCRHCGSAPAKDRNFPVIRDDVVWIPQADFNIHHPGSISIFGEGVQWHRRKNVIRRIRAEGDAPGPCHVNSDSSKRPSGHVLVPPARTGLPKELNNPKKKRQPELRVQRL